MKEMLRNTALGVTKEREPTFMDRLLMCQA